jgi:hypothetical protein
VNRLHLIVPVLIIGCISLIHAAPAPVPQGAQWMQFTSGKYRFTVPYPATWHRLKDITDILDITNFQRSGPEDSIAAHVAGAEITVTGALPGVKDVDDWIRRDLPDSDDLAASEENIPVPELAAKGCTKLKEAAWHEQLSPDTYFVQTSYYCTAADGLYKVSLLNWQDDPRQKELRDLALRMALSLKTQAGH